jgi:hypothetical protein
MEGNGGGERGGRVEEGWEDGGKARKGKRALGRGWDQASYMGVL